MALADRLEDAGIVIGCAILVALPMGALFGIFYDGFFLPWWASLLALTPGTILGVVALSNAPLSYTHVWRFGFTHWIAAVVIWAAFGLENGPESLAIAGWAVAFVIGIVAASADRWLPRLRR